MEDLQKQHAGEQAPRRRRAVRSVPMTDRQEPKPDAVPRNAGTQQAYPSVFPAPEVPTDDIADAVDQATEQIPINQNENRTAEQQESMLTVSDAIDAALSDAINISRIERDSIADMPFPDHAVGFEEPQEPPAGHGSIRELLEDTDTFSAGETFSEQVPSSAASGRRLWTAVGVTAALLVICVLAILPFLRRTEAVMLYLNETPIGYISGEQAAKSELADVLRDLRADTAVPFETHLTYRCEDASVQGKAPLMSSDAIYDAMYAHATAGYVRAYRLTGTDGGVTPLLSAGDGIGIGDPVGVMTEAEILSAVSAAEAVCREQYTSVLPAGTQIHMEPCFSWERAWIAEEDIIGESALVSMIVDMQTTASAMFSVTAERTETEAERIPYETTLVPNDENYDGIRSMISAGADGLAQVSYTVSLNPATGEVLSRTECARTVVREPVHAVAYEGLYPLPDGVSTGSFSWPLPPLPDDELPLDENGDPYVPDNPLALKNTYVSSGYGERLLWGAYDFHLGLDIVAPAYTEIYAADGGVVVYAAYTSSYGYMTRSRHADNVETVYAHQIKQAVKVGDVVEKGQLIGYVGSTGTTSGNHLHLEFRRDHVTVDPSEYITIPEEILILGEEY